MDLDSTTTSQELSYRDLFDQNNHGVGINGLDRPLGCGLCGRSMTLVGEVNGVHQNDSVCDDCKFLLAEDFGIPEQNWARRNSSGRLRSTYGGSDSTTPTDSRRWRRITSETESEFSNSDSYYGESESNISYGAYYHGDSDALSFGTYEGDSDTSVGGRTFFNANIVSSVVQSDLDSDNDIDPMHAGNVRWDFEDSAWEEVDYEVSTVEPMEGRPQVDASGDSGSFRRHRRTVATESLARISRRISEVDLQIRRSRVGITEPSEVPYISDPENYHDSRDFVEFLEHNEEADASRRGPPPASTSFVNELPVIVICEEHQKPNELACAICKDLLTAGTVVSQLPCLHLYHPKCILPWLCRRNTCPLCRYELPMDDIRLFVIETERLDDSSFITDSTDMDEPREALEDVGPVGDISWSNRGRRGWFLFAAAPIVTLMGIAFVFWLGSSRAGRRRGQFNCNCLPADLIQTSDSCPRNEHDKGLWWWF